MVLMGRGHMVLPVCIFHGEGLPLRGKFEKSKVPKLPGAAVPKYLSEFMHSRICLNETLFKEGEGKVVRPPWLRP